MKTYAEQEVESLSFSNSLLKELRRDFVEVGLEDPQIRVVIEKMWAILLSAKV